MAEKKEDPGPSVKDDEMYEALRREGNSKEKSARIANAAANSSRSAVGRKGGDAQDYTDRTKDELLQRAREVGIDWHGHNDRGLGVTNNIIAIEAGADRIHGTALGVGERVGNASLDQTLMNLKLLGAREVVQAAEDELGVPVLSAATAGAYSILRGLDLPVAIEGAGSLLRADLPVATV